MPKFARNAINILLVASAIGILLTVFVYLSLYRLIARDEGYYLLAAKLVAQGARPYTDFFYPQMPLVPYLYGGWILLFGSSWHAARMLSGLLTAGIGILLLFHLWRSYGRMIALTGTALFALSRLAFTQMPTVTTYSAATLLLYAGYVLLVSNWRIRRYQMLAAGLLVGASVCARLPMLAAVPCMLYYLISERRFATNRSQALRYFTVGLVLSWLPLLLFVAADPEAFWFNNIGYHLSKTGLSESEILRTRVRVLSVLFGFAQSGKFEHQTSPLLIYGAILHAVIWFRQKRTFDLAFVICAVLMLVHLTPRPTYLHYFTVLIPFLITLNMELLHTLRHGKGGRSMVPAAGFALLLLCVSGRALYQMTADVRRYTVTGKGVLGIGELAVDEWRVSRVRQIGRAIDSIVEAEETVVAFWPGYLVETHAEILPGLENHFGITYLRRHELDRTARRRFRLRSLEGVYCKIRKRTPRAVIVRSLNRKHQLAETLANSQYTVAKEIGQVTILVRGSDEVLESGGPSTVM